MFPHLHQSRKHPITPTSPNEGMHTLIVVISACSGTQSATADSFSEQIASIRDLEILLAQLIPVEKRIARPLELDLGCA